MKCLAIINPADGKLKQFRVTPLNEKGRKGEREKETQDSITEAFLFNRNYRLEKAEISPSLFTGADKISGYFLTSEIKLV